MSSTLTEISAEEENDDAEETTQQSIADIVYEYDEEYYEVIYTLLSTGKQEGFCRSRPSNRSKLQDEEEEARASPPSDPLGRLLFMVSSVKEGLRLQLSLLSRNLRLGLALLSFG